ncbi:hypothetical protein HHI36_020415 [Cryptolaemus montrouzieri]|uniref:Neuropeptide-like 4 n=1 Tax=Cryptolaemus montrouzieri TaxID=559131 RepID=A0ABD2NAJ9_9CUCU
MFKLIAFFALLAFAFAAPKPDPLSIPLAAYSTPLSYSAINPIYTGLGYSYGYAPYAANYYGGYYNNLGYGLYY